MSRDKVDFGSNGKEATAPKFSRDPLFIPTGSTLLNLALSENPFGGWKVGTVVNIIGDTHAGKTMLAFHAFMEVLTNSFYQAYWDSLYYDESEAAFDFDLEDIFGIDVELIEKIHMDDDELKPSETIEEMFIKARKLLKPTKKKVKGKNKKFPPKPYIYVEDSLDGLESIEEKSKTDKEIGARDYPDKPRIMNDFLRHTVRDIKKTDSLFMIISQTRDKIGATFGSKKRRAGGKALDFFASTVMWLAVKGPEKRKGRKVGNNIRVRVSKNKHTGKQREVEFPIYSDFGIDDMTSMINWMLEEGFWTKGKKAKDDDDGESKGQTINTQGDFIDATRDKLIDHIEDNELEDEFRKIVGECWMQIEKEISTKRKKRYAKKEEN